MVASSLDTLEPVLLEGFESKEDLVACLKASANVPRIAGDPIQLRYKTLSGNPSPPPPPPLLPPGVPSLVTLPQPAKVLACVAVASLCGTIQ